jgi:hypothetical protein
MVINSMGFIAKIKGNLRPSTIYYNINLGELIIIKLIVLIVSVLRKVKAIN